MSEPKKILQIEDCVVVYRGKTHYGYDYVTQVTNKFATTSRGFRLKREITDGFKIEFTSSPQNIGFRAKFKKLSKEEVIAKNKKLLSAYKDKLTRAIQAYTNLTNISEILSMIDIEE